jgi:hypothetical protein
MQFEIFAWNTSFLIYTSFLRLIHSLYNFSWFFLTSNRVFIPPHFRIYFHYIDLKFTLEIFLQVSTWTEFTSWSSFIKFCFHCFWNCHLILWLLVFLICPKFFVTFVRYFSRFSVLNCLCVIHLTPLSLYLLPSCLNLSLSFLSPFIICYAF